jgi:arylsulfatase
MTNKYGFEGKIGRYVKDSEPWFSTPAHPGDDAPNVIFVLLDDTGFAQMGCFGSDIDTPNIDALAANGLQFTNFHVTPLCSPTRAALLSGRANHAVGMRTVSNFITGFPNQLGHISNHAATIAEVLGDAGYGTFVCGKWHLAPMEQCSAAGPFDQWPLARGFNRFYGFLDGETDQFYPELVADNHPIDPPAGPEDGYHLSEDLVDQALKIIADFKGVRQHTRHTKRLLHTWKSIAANLTKAGTWFASVGSRNKLLLVLFLQILNFHHATLAFSRGMNCLKTNAD